jgi:GNAT superfamily N-acetyltransferase
MSFYKQDDDFVYEILTKDSFAECSQLWARVVSEREPITYHLKLSETTMARIFPWGFSACETDRLSLVARDRKTSKLVAYRLCKDLASGHDTGSNVISWWINGMAQGCWWTWLLPVPSDLAAMAHVWIHAADMWKNVYEERANKEAEQQNPENNESRKIIDWSARGEWAQMYGLGVAAGYEGRGIGERITAYTHQLLRERGYRRTTVACSNGASTHIFKTLGYTLRVEMPLDDYLFNGTPRFSGMVNPTTKEPEPTIRLLDVAL